MLSSDPARQFLNGRHFAVTALGRVRKYFLFPSPYPLTPLFLLRRAGERGQGNICGPVLDSGLPPAVDRPFCGDREVSGSESRFPTGNHYPLLRRYNPSRTIGSSYETVTLSEKSNRHSRIRADHSTEVAEDYVEAVAQITGAQGACRAVDLVRQFEVTHATVNRTVARLQRDGFVETQPYQPIRLTTKGKRLAAASRQRHLTVYHFLLALGVSERTATNDSEGIEHHVSRETLRAMKAFVNQRSAAEY